jgi:prepilin-type N-terminal cleavage/methylation domain-containing protein
MKSPHTSRRAASRRIAGFTLVELMVAMAAGTFAIVGIYYLANVWSRSYARQVRFGDAQTSLLTAMDIVRRDFGRAAFLGSRNVNGADHLTCASGNGSVANGAFIQGIDIQYNGSIGNDQVPQLLNTTQNVTRVDLVQMWGNYTTSDSYLVDTAIGLDGQTIGFQTTRESFRRSFFNPGVGGAVATYDKDRFTAAFGFGRWVRVEHNGKYFYRAVTGVNANFPPSITVAALPYPTCFDYSIAIVSPLTRIAYSVEQIGDNGSPALLSMRQRVDDESFRAPGSERAVLVRREVNIDNQLVPSAGDRLNCVAPAPASQDCTARPVLDYAVEFAVDGVVATGTPPVFSLANTQALLTATPAENFRAVRVTLSARAAGVDPNLPRIPRAALTDPFLAFRIPVGANAVEQVLSGANASGAVEFWAPVRTLSAEIFLSNMATKPQ